MAAQMGMQQKTHALLHSNQLHQAILYAAELSSPHKKNLYDFPADQQLKNEQDNILIFSDTAKQLLALMK